MYFEFQAHHPKARTWFLIFLLVVSVVNIAAIGLWPSLWQQKESLLRAAGLLVVPWFLLLLLPSVLSAVLLYRSLFRPHRFHISEKGLLMATLKSGRLEQSVLLPWDQVKQVQLIDFEDNHYCLLRFVDGRYDRVLDRSTGDFPHFFNEIIQHIDPAVVRMH
ncbi:MAG: hypothetical protein RMK52_08055 [Chitinophagales bacterium]|nr:hypothetical protein [Chitinophagales bacterium]MDW8394180.1 hypothetical protein [Chitinophagales bacterium]